MASLEARLREIDDLLGRGLVTADEAQLRRQSILSGSSHEESGTRGGIAVLICAVAGAILGVMFGFVAMAVGGASNALEEGSGDGVVGLGVSAIIAAGFGLLVAGAYFVGKKRTLMAWLLLVAAFWHLISISYFGIPGFAFILLAAVFAWFGRKS